MKKNLVTAGAIVATALAPAMVFAQTERSAGTQSYNLVQVSVAAKDVSPEDFEARTAALASCAAAIELARELKGEAVRNRLVRASQLPEGLRDQLAELPVGHATSVYSGDGKTLRVLVLCNRV